MSSLIRTLILSFIYLAGFDAYAQIFTISGVVKDSLSFETLPYASIQLTAGSFSTQANAYGHFSMRVPRGEYLMTVSYVGYGSRTLNVKVSSDVSLIPLLSSTATTLKEANISDHTFVQEAVPGRNRVSMEQIQKQPSFAGEADVLKSLQFLPGVKSPSEATTNISVRGGTYDQTLILLDGAPVYNSSHALGFFSTFNADAIKDVELYKGLIPSRFGNRLSSVVDIRMRDGNVNKYQAKIGIGLIASRLTLEGPIKKGVSSFIISGRYSYAGDVVNKVGEFIVKNDLTKKDIRTDNLVKFYDLNAKLNFGDKAGRNRFFISAYTGNDKFYYYILQGNTRMDWGNKTASLQWNRKVNSRLFMISSATYSKYSYHYQITDDNRRFDWNANQDELNFKTEFDYAISKSYAVNFGIQFTQNNNQPGRIDPLDTLAVAKPFRLPKKHSVISAVFAENIIGLGESVKLVAGLRASMFALLGPFTSFTYASPESSIALDSTVYNAGKIVKSYSGFEPRLAATWLLSQNKSIKASLNQTVQFSHLLTNSSVGLPTDIWVPSSQNIKPQRAMQGSLGYYQNTPDNKYQFTAEAYYKKMHRVIDFIDNADLFVNKNVESQIRVGNGTAYGLEAMVSKLRGNLTYQISYTLSKTYRHIEGVNNNNPYPGRDDRRHALSIFGLYTFPKRRLELSSNFVLNSGAPITMPSNTFYYQGATFYSYEGRNHYKLPAYHRLDVSLILHNRPKTHFEGSWSFSIYNLYNRKNVFTAVSRTLDFASFKYYQVSGLSPFGIVPSITYNLILK